MSLKLVRLTRIFWYGLLVVVATEHQVLLTRQTLDSSGSRSNTQITQRSPDTVDTDTGVDLAISLQSLGLKGAVDCETVLKNILDVFEAVSC